MRLVTAIDQRWTDDESPQLAEALGAEIVGWDDPTVDWSVPVPHVIRSTWNYTSRLDEFLAWADTVSQLWNPAKVIRWNSNKRYLLDLATRGVPVVPTVAPGWDRVVVKPAVGVGADGFRVIEDEVIVQPVVSSIRTRGETSVVWVAGAVTHAVLKRPVSGELRVQESLGGSNEPVEPTPDQLAVVRAAIAAVDEPLLYARVDLVDWEGRPHVSELELIEPTFYLHAAPASVDEVVARLRSVSA